MKKLILGAMSTLSLCAISEAVQLLQYDYNDASDLAASFTAANIAGTNTVVSGGSNSTLGPGNHVVIENSAGPLTDGVIAFTISSTNGDFIDLSTISFQNYSGSIVFNYEVFVNTVSAAAEQAAVNTLNTVDLSAYANATSFDIEIRAKSPDSSFNTVRVDDITIDGDLVAVPEPSSSALLGLGGLALILRRRK